MDMDSVYQYLGYPAQANDDSGTSSRENLWMYGVGTFVVLGMLGWLYRDSLAIEDVKEKYVFVTGCDSGFGNFLCKKLDRWGFRVIAGCLGKGTRDLKRATGPYRKVVLLDVKSTASIQKVMEYTKQEVGDNDIQIQRLIMNEACDSDLSKESNCMEHALVSSYPPNLLQWWLGRQVWMDPSLLHAILCHRYWAETGDATSC